MVAILVVAVAGAASWEVVEGRGRREVLALMMMTRISWTLTMKKTAHEVGWPGAGRNDKVATDEVGAWDED